MTVQFLEIAGQRVAVLPAADYERLIAVAEERGDEAAARTAEARRAAGEEYLPAGLLDRIIGGENALKVWREHRGLSQADLAASAGCTEAMVSHIEQGRRVGAAPLLASLASVLGTSVDDLLPLP